MHRQKLNNARLESISVDVKDQRLVKHRTDVTPLHARLSLLQLLARVPQAHLDVGICGSGRKRATDQLKVEFLRRTTTFLPTCGIPAVVHHAQVASLYHDHGQPFGRGQVGERDHQFAEFYFGVLLPARRQLLPQLHFVREIDVGQGNLRAADANVPRVGVKVVQQHLQGATADDSWTFLEHKVLVKD